jgi:hypothetical protein
LPAATGGAHPTQASAAQWAGDFQGEAASADARELLRWIAASGDNHGLPFIVIDKRNAKVFVFSRQGKLQGAAAALLGLSRGTRVHPGSVNAS